MRSLLKNIYIWNLLGLILVSVLLSFLILKGLDRYTQHGKAVEVPDIKGLSVKRAEPFLTNKKLNFIIVDSVYIKDAIPGTISETTPPKGSKVKEGRTVYLKIVAFFPNLIAIPDVKDSSQRQSLARLRSLGFENIEIKTVPGFYRDLVLGIESKGVPMEEGQRVPANTPLSLLVSSGSDEILVLENPMDSDSVNFDETWF